MTIRTYARHDTLLRRATRKFGLPIRAAVRGVRHGARILRNTVVGGTPVDLSQTHSSQEDEQSNHVDSSEEVSLQTESGAVADKKVKFITNQIMEIVDENGPLLKKSADRETSIGQMKAIRNKLNDAVNDLGEIDGFKDDADYLKSVLPISDRTRATVDSFRTALADFGRDALALQMKSSSASGDHAVWEAYSAAGHFTNA